MMTSRAASFHWPVAVDLRAAGLFERWNRRPSGPPSVEVVHATVAWLSERTPTEIYVIAGVLLSAEVGLLAGLAVPAASIMIGMGALASIGHLDLTTAIAVAVIAALLGDSVGYWEGRFLGPRLRAGRLGRRIGIRRWQRAERIVRRGAPAIAVGRCTAFVRTLVPRVAGAAGVGYAIFLAYEVPAVLVWIPGTILIGYAGAAPIL